MNTQPEALRLADILQHKIPSIECLEKAAAELRRLHQSEREGWRYADELEQERKRLHEVNQMLVETLDWLDTWLGDKPMVECSHKITKALAKAKEQA